MIYAEVILPLYLSTPLSYSVPEELEGNIAIGSLVVVQVGKRKYYTAVVLSISEVKPAFDTKFIQEVLDEFPPIPSVILDFWLWISRYYYCYPSEVATAALPAGLKLDNTLLIGQGIEFDQFQHILPALPAEGIPLSDWISALSTPFSMKELQELTQKGAIQLLDKWDRKGRQIGISALRIPENKGEESLIEFLDNSRAPKQKELLLAFLGLVEGRDWIEKNRLVPSLFSHTLLKSLIAKGLLEELILDPSLPTKNSGNPLYELTAEQEKAYGEINAFFKQKKPVLLQGVTSSGKTEVYSYLIKEVLEHKGQALFLMPEIALTTQMILRMQRHFGDQVLVYHSQLNDYRRTEAWKHIAEGRPVLVLGARSSLLLPFSNLQLILVDEEHEPSYKQQDPAPRYHARDSAIYLARSLSIPILLGSATPSLELFASAKEGKFGWVKLLKRFNDRPLPKIELVDIRKMTKEDEGLSEALVNEMRNTLARKEQIILFQNRRGFSPFVVCSDCGHTAQCHQCDIGLSYHKYNHSLKCHYCGYRETYSGRCQSCKSLNISIEGLGTQRIEARIKDLFPTVGVDRMDVDSTRNKNSLQKIFDRFDKQESSILIGTQMVTKGLDFRNVGLVGVISADSLLSFPDFRNHERTYQLIAQVAGRAGRGSAPGKVLVQTRNKTHELLKNLRDYDYDTIYQRELWQRRTFFYPPYTRLLRIILGHKEVARVQKSSQELGKQLLKKFGAIVLGPEEPSVGRLKNQYLRQFLLKIPIDHNPSDYKRALHQLLNLESHQSFLKGIRIIVDIDPIQ